jgi:proteasome lid subunit RPN8/RPN11
MSIGESETDYWVAEAARHNPLAWAIRAELAAKAELAVRTRTVQPTEPTSRVGTILYRPDQSPKHRLRLAGDGAGLMRDFVCRAGPLGLETGGFLWGDEAAAAGAVSKVAKASGPAPDAEHWERAIRLGNPSDVDEGKLRAEFVPVGDWHLHPVGDGRPSGADREGWVQRLGSGLRSWVSVIVSRQSDVDYWGDARMTAWVTYRDPAIGRHVVEPAEIVVERSEARRWLP